MATSNIASNGFDILFFKRFWNIQRLIFPGLSSVATALFGFIFIIALLEQYIIYNVGLIPSRFYKVLGDKDLAAFKEVTWQSLSLIVIIALIKSVREYLENILNITWRQLLSRAMHRLYFFKINYYQLNVLDGTIDNPDQRITQDVDKLCTLYSSIICKVLIAPFIISYYSYIAYTNTGWFGPTSIYVYFVFGSIVNKVLMSPIVRRMMEQEMCEGDFRFKHMLIRVNSESLAFHGSTDLESYKTNLKLDSLILTQKNLFNRQLALSLSVNLFDYIGSIISYLLLAIPIFAGVYDSLTPSELSAMISQNAFVCIYLISTFSSLVDISGRVGNLAGVTHRVAQFLEHLNHMDTDEDSFYFDTESMDDKEISLEIKGEGDDSIDMQEDNKRFGWDLRDVSFGPPQQNKDLVKNLTLTIVKGVSLLIRGSSSSGKSSLLRVLKCLWPVRKGTVTNNLPYGTSGAFYLPQKPFLTTGTLREQIIYPLRHDENCKTDDSNVLEVLRLVHMESLLERLGTLDTIIDWNWYDILSPGEMQRLAFARVLYHKPMFAVLDEATSAISGDLEEILHNQCIKLGITLVSVGHRESLMKYHTKLLTLDGEGGWSLEDIKQKIARSSSSSSSSSDDS